MRPENETSEPELIAKAFQEISKEITHRGLAKALLKAALGYFGAVRGAVLLSQGGELLVEADAGFLRERVKYFVSQPSASELRMPYAEHSTWPNVARLFLPLIHRERTIGVLYLESEPAQKTFTPICLSVISMLAPRAAVSFESAQLSELTLLSRGSSQCSRIFDFDLNLNPVPFKAFRHGGRIWVEKNKMRGTAFTFALPRRQSVQMSGSF